MTFNGADLPVGFEVSGFRWAGVPCGIKGLGQPDLALIFSDTPCQVAGLFTTNRVKGAPVILTQERVKKSKVQAVIINSGNANAGTGQRGIKDAQEMAARTARGLGISEEAVLVCSTGRIGEWLPMVKIRKGIGPLVSSLTSRGYREAAEAIRTTDRYPKIVGRRERFGGRWVNFLAICKGAGMIQPGLATMLSFMATDLRIGRRTLGTAVRKAVDESFNCISVDGQRSTNDTVLVMANGLAGNGPLEGNPVEEKRLQDLLTKMHLALAKAIIKDGEGASRLLEITVKGALSRTQAKKGAFAVANSSLVKTAFFGQQLNWGRIISALGAADIDLYPDRLDISIGGVKVVKGGVKVSAAAENKAARALKEDEIKVMVDLNMGEAQAGVFASDLTYDYVRLNASHEGH